MVSRMSIASARLGEYSAPVRISRISPQKGEVFTTWSRMSLMIMAVVFSRSVGSRVRREGLGLRSLTKLRLRCNQGLAPRVYAPVKAPARPELRSIRREFRMSLLLLIIILVLLFGGGGGYY